ncbi:hypothetical protein HanRHA438_Chr12g0548881 [Helianthus annuus]|nr:hypothetical protein HanRHA438_Chr12g0548881 [Helianthus annuus]
MRHLLTEPVNTFFLRVFFNKETVICLSKNCLYNWSIIKVIVLTQDRFDRTCGLNNMIMGNGGEQMVNHMSIRFIMEDSVQNPIISINSS